MAMTERRGKKKDGFLFVRKYGIEFLEGISGMSVVLWNSLSCCGLEIFILSDGTMFEVPHFGHGKTLPV
jgi:hypothetical protein